MDDLFGEHDDGSGLLVKSLDSATACKMVVEHHYLHREPPICWAYGLWDGGNLRGVVTFGFPASREMQKSACPTDPASVLELNRLWVDDRMPRNSESWFVSRALSKLPPAIVVSYADTAQGHAGYIYRALNFHYAGWTDMDRKTPRWDYPSNGKHSRDAFRGGRTLLDIDPIRVPRSPKVRYWIAAGPDRRVRAQMASRCAWPSKSWKAEPPPTAT